MPQLSNLITPIPGLSSLEAPFSNTEIDEVVRNLPPDKALGQDGFNGYFLKKCWNIIKDDFYRLCAAFHQAEVNLQPLNNSYIALIPKTDCPTTVKDYRPISLVNSAIKIITKILANRLQPFMGNFMHQNQYGFIKGHSIQDCLAWVFDFTHQCHRAKKPVALLKLDFTQAFDRVEHAAIFAMLAALGFPPTWINWIRLILQSAQSAIILNGSVGKYFRCKRGVRQGDPLSPLLFVIVGELLQFILNNASSIGALQAPSCLPQADFPVIQYADDTIIYVEATQRNLFNLKIFLNSFSAATGLTVNLAKSCIIPINLDSDQADILARTFGCPLGQFPLPYLGLPLGSGH
ncbi:hypothetical protein GUJ93_ZPchr0004g39317 [Zizania palustris]|uniref:Reverse transcriptase domain-containing protein n=1 Tax=Zizania palustris TaxID=103762 RepID=A0A8J5VNR1_ZIZPA|nr:hypothetical protein GUJ93_ZPchr0004g39317 [Zizania palustris]